MNSVQRVKVQSQEANLEGNIFKLTPVVKSSRSSFPPVQLDLDSFIREIKKNQFQFFGFSTQGTTLRQMFSKGALKEAPIQKKSQIDSMDNSRINSFEQEERLQCLPIKQQEIQDISVAFPDINICYICKQRFQNYFQHISSNKHKKNQKGGLVQNGQQNTSIQFALTELIGSINKANPNKGASRKASKRCHQDKRVLRVTDKMEELEDEQASSPRKLRILSNGRQVSIKSNLSTQILNQISLPRKGSFFS